MKKIKNYFSCVAHGFYVFWAPFPVCLKTRAFSSFVLNNGSLKIIAQLSCSIYFIQKLQFLNNYLKIRIFAGLKARKNAVLLSQLTKLTQ